MKNEYLQKEKHLYYPDIVLFFDVETDTRRINNDLYSMDFKLGSYILYSFKQNKELKRKIFYTKEEFITDLFDFVDIFRNITIISHNIDFDIKVLSLFDYLKKHNYSIYLKPLFENLFYVVFKENNNLSSEDKKTIKILDSFNIFKDNLANLGKAIGHKKIEIDFKKCTMEELANYCINDVEILLKLFICLINFLKENNISFKISVAGIALSSYRNNFLEKISINTPYEIKKKERMAYKGGRVECFVLGDITEKIYYVDVNSLYPYCSTFELPYKFEKVVKRIGLMQLEKLLNEKYIIANLDFEIYKNCIGIKRKIDKTEKLIFPIGKIKNEYLHNSEIELILKYGKIHNINEVLIYKKDVVLKRYVEHYYNLKQNSKGTSNYLFYKYLLNSLYGKFGQRMRLVKKVKDVFISDGYYIINDGDKFKYMVVFNGIGYIYQKSIVYSPFSNIAIAGSITAYGRSYLYNMMELVGLENCYYCDTDGILINEAGFKNLEKNNCIGEELGKFKLEETGFAKIFNCKWYILNNKLKIKGIKKGFINPASIISENEDYIEYTQEKVERIRTAIRNKRTDKQIVEIFVKRMSKKYDKGFTEKTNNLIRVKPFILYEF